MSRTTAAAAPDTRPPDAVIVTVVIRVADVADAGWECAEDGGVAATVVIDCHEVRGYRYLSDNDNDSKYLICSGLRSTVFCRGWLLLHYI